MSKLWSWLQRWFPLLILVGLSAWCLAYAYTHPSELSAITEVSPGILAILLVLALTKIVWQGLFTQVIVRGFGIELAFKEWFGLAAISALGNYLTPFRGGATMRALYLKSRHGLSYSLFISTLSTLYVLTFATSALFGLLAFAALYLWYGMVDLPLTTFFLVCAVLPLMPWFLTRIAPMQEIEHAAPLVQKANMNKRYGVFLDIVRSKTIPVLRSIVRGWQVLTAQKTTLARLILLSVLNVVTSLLMISFSFRAFGAQLALPQSLVLSSLFMTSSLIPLTPSGLGLAEFLVVSASQQFGVSQSLGVFSAGLNRSILLLSSLVWGSISSFALGQVLRVDSDSSSLPDNRV